MFINLNSEHNLKLSIMGLLVLQYLDYYTE